jgi:hypothetical protein
MSNPQTKTRACRVCGRPLTDPASVAAGVGPICGGKGGRQHEPRERNGGASGFDLFRSTYSWTDDGRVVAIIDSGIGKSVADDAEMVIAELVAAGVLVDQREIIYRDTTGTWDRILTRQGKFAGFGSPGAKDRQTTYMQLMGQMRTPQ